MLANELFNGVARAHRGCALPSAPDDAFAVEGQPIPRLKIVRLIFPKNGKFLTLSSIEGFECLSLLKARTAEPKKLVSPTKN